MRDAQKGRKSWLERLTSPPETDAAELVTEPDPAPVREQPRAPWADQAPMNRPWAEQGAAMEPQSEHPLFRPSQPPHPSENGQPNQDPTAEDVNGNGAAAPAEVAEDYAPVGDSSWAPPPAEPEQEPAAAPEPFMASVATAEGATMSAENADHPTPTIGNQWEGSDRSVTSNIATPEDIARADTGEQPADTSWQPVDRTPVAEPAGSVDAATMPSLDPEPSEEERIEDERRQRIAELQHRWLVTQAQILDDPRDAVREAGLLIGDALQFLTTTYSGHRDRIERSWKNDDSMSTDELRDTMRRYRALFQHVLSVTRIPGQ